MKTILWLPPDTFAQCLQAQEGQVAYHDAALSDHGLTNRYLSVTQGLIAMPWTSDCAWQPWQAVAYDAVCPQDKTAALV